MSHWHAIRWGSEDPLVPSIWVRQLAEGVVGWWCVVKVPVALQSNWIVSGTNMQDGMHRLRLGTKSVCWLALFIVFRGLTQIYDFLMIISEGLTSPSFQRLDSSASTILHFTSSRCQGDCNHPNLAFLRQTAPWRCPFSIRLSEPEGNQLGRCRLWPLFEDPSLQKFHFFNSKIAKNEDRL